MFARHFHVLTQILLGNLSFGKPSLRFVSPTASEASVRVTISLSFAADTFLLVGTVSPCLTIASHEAGQAVDLTSTIAFT